LPGLGFELICAAGPGWSSACGLTFRRRLCPRTLGWPSNRAMSNRSERKCAYDRTFLLPPRSGPPEPRKRRPVVDVTADLLARISENPDPEAYDLAGDAKALAPAMRDGEIDTPRRVQMFLANIIQETDALKTLAEYDSWDGTYLRSKRYYPYYGRGYIQLTWQDNYRAAGDALGVNLVADPSLLERDKDLAARAAVWYWNSRGCSAYADRGDFGAVCELINRGVADGGPVNGWNARLYYYERAKRFVKAEPAKAEPAKAEPAPITGQVPDSQAGLRELRRCLQIVRESERLILARIAELEKERPDEPDRPEPDRPKPVKPKLDKPELVKPKLEKPEPVKPQKPMEEKRWQFTTLVPPSHRDVPPNPASGSYVERHPSRYRWRDDIADLIRELYRRFGPDKIHINTYHDHPEDFGRDLTSFDVWGVRGRGHAIDSELGAEITRWLYRKAGAPHIDWIIWWAQWWDNSFPVDDWRPFGENPFTWHKDHVHVTYV
jgi:predicted chitinase